MTSYLGDSAYRPILPHQHFGIKSHFDKHNNCCYEKTSSLQLSDSFVDPASGRPLLEKISRAVNVQKPGRVDLVLPKRQTSELTFNGYFKDITSTSVVVRKCNITFFLEDNTIRVYEPKTTNSGYIQGEFLKRSLVLNPVTMKPYTAEDFALGSSITICGRTIFIADADEITRRCQGIDGETTPIPKGRSNWPYQGKSPISVTYSASQVFSPNFGRSSTLSTPPAQHKINNFKRFLQYDGSVLRFFGIWRIDCNDRAMDRNVILYFHLSDNSVEIVHGESRDKILTSRILKRQQVVKEGRAYNCIEHTENLTNITALDFQCGKVVNVLGKRIYLTHADQFTIDWYSKNIPNINQVSAAKYQVPKACLTVPVQHFNGYGSCIDDETGLEDDLDATDDRVELRFRATLFHNRYSESDGDAASVDEDRNFIISFFPGDRSCMVIELPSSASVGGTYLQRGLYRYFESRNQIQVACHKKNSVYSSTNNLNSIAARRFRCSDFACGRVISFESEPISGSNSRCQTIPCGPRSARFVIKEADAFAVEYLRREAIRHKCRLQDTLDVLRSHFIVRSVTPCWVRNQMNFLKRPKLTKKEFRNVLNSIELQPSAFSNRHIDFLFEEYGEIDHVFGHSIFYDDLIDDLVRPQMEENNVATNLDSPVAVLAMIEKIPRLRTRLRQCDVDRKGCITAFDLQIILRQNGIIAPTNLLLICVAPHSIDRNSGGNCPQTFDYNTFCTECMRSAWALPLRQIASKQVQRVEANEQKQAKTDHAYRNAIAPPSSIAAIAGLGPNRTGFSSAPEYHFYRDLLQKTEDANTTAMRNRMLGSKGVSEALTMTKKK